MNAVWTRPLAVWLSVLASVVFGLLPARAAIDSAVTEKLARMNVPFVPNQGQWDEQAAFAAQTFAGTMFVTTEGKLVYSLPGKPIGDKPSTTSQPRPSHFEKRDTERTPGWVLTETFVGANQQAIIVIPNGYRPAVAKVSYFMGNDHARHQRGLDTFERIDLGNVFPGINVQLRATGTNVEKIFTVAPRQDPNQIQLRVDGAIKLEVNAQGELVAHTDNGPITYTAPIAFQENALGDREAVGVKYVLDTNAQTSHYGFALASYDTARPLVIDPLLRSTYLGAAGFDVANALAIHPLSGDVYVAGFTTSTTNTFPGVVGGARGNNGGGVYDAFVSRFSADLTILIKSSYLGAGTSDIATAVAIHPVSGDVYVAGYTDSTTNTFPGTTGSTPGLGVSGGGTDAFVSRFSADLTTLIKSSYLGAGGTDVATALAIHGVTGDVYVAGYTGSTTNTFPGVIGGAQGSNAGGTFDTFVSYFSADLTLIKSSYLGAASVEVASALAIHPLSGEVYVAGYTGSPTTTFPGVSGGAQGTTGGGGDAFVSRFSANLTTLIKSTYLGGAGLDQAFALAIHPVSGEVYVAGFTDSPFNTFPGVSGGAQGNSGGGTDGFVSRLSADLTTILKSSYLGVAGNEQVNALAIHPGSGEVYVAGFTDAPTTTFPGVSGGAQGSTGAGTDAFVSRFSADLTLLVRSSYLGAGGVDQANAIAIHPVTGDVYLAGYTDAPNNTFPGVSGGAQGTNGGGNDAFLSRLSGDLTLADTTPNAFAFASQNNVPVSSVRTSAPVQIAGLGGIASAYVEGRLGSTFCVSSSNTCSCDVSGSFVQTGLVSNSQYVCIRHTASSFVNEITTTTLHIGAQAAKFRASTGNIFASCSLDVDGNNIIDALTDGLIILRAMFGLTGSSVTNSAVGAGATRATWAALQPYLNGNCGSNFAP